MAQELLIINNFINEKDILKINKELNKIFEQPLLNGYVKGSIFSIDKKTYQVRECFLPIQNINSVNLLEIAITIHKKIFKTSDDMILTNLMVNSEKGNHNELKMHTDNRIDMIRATLYLTDTDKNSGGFYYVKNSSNRDYYVHHEVDNITKKKLENDIIDCSGKAGDLIIFNSYGFHGKYKCINERRTIIFEFQKRNTKYPKSTININNLKLSKYVLDNMDILMPGEYKESYTDHGSDVFNEKYLLQKNYLIKSTKILFEYLKFNILNKLNKLKNFLKKKIL